jgi:enamine deaminase RidA (YjgF/YER057c/UK114 family)
MKVLLPHGWDAPVGYANGIAAGSGTLVFVAGQVGWDAQQKFARRRSRRSSSRR